MMIKNFLITNNRLRDKLTIRTHVSIPVVAVPVVVEDVLLEVLQPLQVRDLVRLGDVGAATVQEPERDRGAAWKAKRSCLAGHCSYHTTHTQH